MTALEVMVGSYPHTAALKSGQVHSDKIVLNIADVASASSAFKRVVELKYDVAELSVPTFLIARSMGVPLSLLPADLFKRAKPPELIYDADRLALRAADLEGQRIGVAYYTATTSIWMQCLIGNAAVDPSTVQWVAIEPPLVDDFKDPDHVQRVSDKSLLKLLEEEYVDAIVTATPPTDPRYKAVSFSAFAKQAPKPFPDMQSHHMLVCRSSVARERPEAVRELWRMLLAARSAALQPGSPELPYGIEANRAHLDAAIDACFNLHLIGKRPSVDELFDDLAATLPPSG
jgi:4,5-dihydroxyphthalate decarboxylase